MSKAIEKKFASQPIRKVIIHTDRGTQFSSKAYNNFIKHYDAFVISISIMSRAIAERFMRTFKNHQINGKTFEQAIQEPLIL